MIEVNETLDDQDQTLVDLFKQPGFNSRLEHQKQAPDLSFEGQLWAENHQETQGIDEEYHRLFGSHLLEGTNLHTEKHSPDKINLFGDKVLHVMTGKKGSAV